MRGVARGGYAGFGRRTRQEKGFGESPFSGGRPRWEGQGLSQVSSWRGSDGA